MKVSIGLKEFAEEPARAGESMRGLLEFAKGRVPEREWEDTKVWLVESGGLAGMGSDARRRILESCRGVLRGSGFRFKDEWASSITGLISSLVIQCACYFLL